ncbi:MAG: DNA translocase FtsK [Lentisphaerae bacterium]|nr:DNA translocase FtsK [Lentisphaerota bacterium]
MFNRVKENRKTPEKSKSVSAAKKTAAEKTAEAEKVVFRFRYCVYISVALVTVLAICTHDATDFAIIAGGREGIVKNWAGEIGARISTTLFYFFGIAVYPITALLLACAIRPFIRIPIARKGYVLALVMMILGISVIFAYSPERFAPYTDSLGIGRVDMPSHCLSGGVIGQWIAAPDRAGYPGVFRRLVGSMGTLICASVFVVGGALFIWMADWQPVFKKLWNMFLEAAARRREREIGLSEKTPSQSSVKEKAFSEEAPEPEPVFAPTPVSEPMPAAVSGVEPAPAVLTIRPPDPLELEHDARNNLDKNTLSAASQPEKGSPVTPLSKAALDPHLQRSELHEIPGSNIIPKVEASSKIAKEYVLPPVSMLSPGKNIGGESDETIAHISNLLQTTLNSFNVDGQVIGAISGPRVTRYEISLAPGVKVEKVSSIQNNIKMELAAQSLRILAPIPGRNAVGVEVPNKLPEAVFLRSLMETPDWKNNKLEIPVVLGKDVGGKTIILDLSRAPHLLIAGSTGSGKSVCMNTLIMSLLMKFTPDELRLIMVDPKVVEMEMYQALPHLITPVVNDPQKVPVALRWAVNEMEKRYRIMAKVRAKNLNGFNNRKDDTDMLDDNGNPIPDQMPILVIIVDELADVMMTDAKADVETSIARIAQKGRAAGIHIVIATQRPSVQVITGIIKANLPTRIAFKVTSGVDSRVILDKIGAEELLGRGDMLFVPPGASAIERIQGAMVDDRDIEKIVEFVSAQAPQSFDQNVVSDDSEEDNSGGSVRNYSESSDEASIDEFAHISPLVQKYSEPGDDELMLKSLEIVLMERKASTSYLQRRLKIGYNRAAEIIDKLEERGIVSPPLAGGSKRDILIFDDIVK